MKYKLTVGQEVWVVQKPLLCSKNGRFTKSRDRYAAIVSNGCVSMSGQTLRYNTKTGADDVVDVATCTSAAPEDKWGQTIFEPGVTCFRTKAEAEDMAEYLRKVGYSDVSLGSTPVPRIVVG